MTSSVVSASHLALNSAVTQRISGDEAAVNPEEVSGLDQGSAQIRALPSTQEFEQPGFSEKRGEERRQELAHAVKNINEFFQMVKRTLQFTVSEDTGRMVIQIKDAETDEVIRQIPSDDVLKLAQRLDEFKGLLLEEKV